MRKRNVFIFLSLFILFISLVFTLKIDITFRKFVDSYFIISGLTTSLFLLKLLLEIGVLDSLRYSFIKTKRHIFFFLPKYYHIDEDTVKTFDDYIDYKEEKKWKSLPSLIGFSLIHLSLSVILSLIIYL